MAEPRAKPPALTAEQIVVGRTYRAKRPTKNWISGQIDNDRVVIWMDTERSIAQYDGPTVAIGRHYPKVDMEKFLKWASHEVTADGEKA
jgi:hypothetical protein